MELRGDGPGRTDRLDWDRRPAGRPDDRPQNRTARGDILALTGAGFLAITVIDFLRNVDAVIAAGRTGPQAGKAPPAGG